MIAIRLLRRGLSQRAQPDEEGYCQDAVELTQECSGLHRLSPPLRHHHDMVLQSAGRRSLLQRDEEGV